MGVRLASTALVAVFVLCGSALAEKPNLAAKAHFEAGTKDFDLNEYAAALVEFKEAYRLKPDPVYLYNIAQCHRLLKQPDDAIAFYRSYLRRAPDAPNRADVEQKIAQMQELIDHPPVVTPPPETKVEPPPPPVVENAVVATPPKKTPIYKKWWLWTAVAGGVVAIGLGVGLGVGLTRSHAPNQLPGVTF